MPPAKTFPNANEWGFEKQFGPPDVIVKTKPYTLPARGQDVVAAGRADRRDQGPLHQGDLGQAVEQGRAAAHHANTEFVQFDEKTGGYVETERRSTRWARSAKSFLLTAAARCRQRARAGTSTTIRPAKSSKTT